MTPDQRRRRDAGLAVIVLACVAVAVIAVIAVIVGLWGLTTWIGA